MKKKQDNKPVADALFLVLQFGINMLVPIFICSLFGVWLGRRLGIDWMMIPFFFVGALAGCTSVYKMSKKLIKGGKSSRSDRSAEDAKKDK